MHITVAPATGAGAASASPGNGDVHISSVEKLGSGVTEVGVEAPADATVVLESSSNLADWQAVGTKAARDGTAIFVDAAPGDGKPRFYRAKGVE